MDHKRNKTKIEFSKKKIKNYNVVFWCAAIQIHDIKGNEPGVQIKKTI